MTSPLRPVLRSLLATGITLALASGVVACSSDDGDDAQPGTGAAGNTGTTEQPTEGGSNNDSPADTEAGGGGGSATLTIDGQTWEFSSLVCGFGEEETGVPGAEWNMSARNGSLALYAALEPDNTYIELGDLDDTEALSLTTTDDVTITLDGRSASATATFTDINDYGSELTGELKATCP